MTIAWSPERLDLLRSLWAERVPCSDIARKLGGVTRSAVIGKAHRLGLESRARVAQPPAPKPVPQPRDPNDKRPRPGGSDFWTPERTEALIRAFKEEKSFAQIAKAVGDGCTRNQAMGKAARLGLPPRGALSDVSRFNARTRRPKSKAGQPPKVPVALVAPPPIDEPGLATVLTARARHCRWPIGEPRADDFTFCGRQVVPGRPYCPSHLARAVVPPVSHSKHTKDPVKALIQSTGRFA